MIVVTLQDYKPSSRADGQPWTQYKIQEGVSKSGPWTDLIQTNLSPVDTDPENPILREFTFETDNTDQWYRVVFIDPSLNEEASIPRWNHESANLLYLPTVDQVARRLLSRTKDKFGKIAGTFTANTLPTDDQVEDIIFDAVKGIADQIGDTVPDELIDDASDVVALAAAIRIELNFFPDQVNTGRSIYPQLEEELNGKYTGRNFKPGMLQKLQRQITMMNEGEVAVTDSEPSRRASLGGFDCDTTTLERRGWGRRRW